MLVCHFLLLPRKTLINAIPAESHPKCAFILQQSEYVVMMKDAVEDKVSIIMIIL